MTRKNFTVDDASLSLKAAGLIAASAAGSLIADLGAGYVEGKLVIDVTALEVDTGDESYDIVLTLSPDSDFGTPANVREGPSLNLGAATPKRTDCNAADVVGRYIVPFCNLHGSTIYRYARLYTVVAGTIVTGINYTCRIAK